MNRSPFQDIASPIFCGMQFLGERIGVEKMMA